MLERSKHLNGIKMSLNEALKKSARKERNLTRHQLGELVGAQKSQISKLESNTNMIQILSSYSFYWLGNPSYTPGSPPAYRSSLRRRIGKLARYGPVWAGWLSGMLRLPSLVITLYVFKI